MKTDIERVALNLPAGFADRAPAIARLLGQALAEQTGGCAGRYAVVDAGSVRVDARDSDRAIACSIAGAIADALRARRTGFGAAAKVSSPEDAPCSRR